MPYSILSLLFISAVILSFQFIPAPSTPGKEVEKYYQSRLNLFEKKIIAFQNAILLKASKKTLQQSFFQIRLAYKQAAILTEYYNVLETKSLNGPAIPWIEEDNPKKIIAPHGMQVIEDILFADAGSVKYALLKNELAGMLTISETLRKEKNLDYKFSDGLVLDALQSALIRLITTGITGFDSPIALYSIPEGKSTLESLQQILSIYKETLDRKAPGKYDSLNALLKQSIVYAGNNPGFNSFDRLFFIKKYFSPAYSLLAEARIANGLIPQSDRTPINPLATSFFDSNAFNINAFSPTNRFRPTKERIELGRQLFYDPILSATKKRTCATCHKPEMAFTDGLKTALAVDEKTYLLRNTPTLWNSALQTKQFFDSRTTVLENQLSSVVHNQEEMKGSLKEAVALLEESPLYTELFLKAYPDEYEKISPYNIANAISSYMRSLISFNSRFDLHMRGEKDILTTVEKKGFNLFMGKAKCATCHYIPLFNGLAPPFYAESESEVLGVPKTKNKKNATLDEDIGKISFSQSSIHKYSFKTPALRNIALTAPYMHNGVYTTLEEVMEFYNNGGGAGLKIAPDNQTLPSQKLNLTKNEIAAVIAFMKTLTSASPGAER